MNRFKFFFLAMAIALGAPWALGQESAAVPAGGPFCGVRALYTALKVEGIDVQFEHLLDRRYVGSRSGSTMDELRRGAGDYHAHAQLLTNLSVTDLRQLRCPTILHVKNEYDALQYNHFILCVPTRDGRLELYDPPDPAIQTSGGELAALWDGTALAVSAEPIPLGSLRAWAALRVILLVTAVIGALFWLPSILRQRFAAKTQGTAPRRLRPSVQCLVLIFVAGIAAAAQHVCTSSGFLAQSDAVSALVAARASEPLSPITLAQAQQLFSDGARFIDARGPADFNVDHITGATNLPPDASRLDRATALEHLANRDPLVVYCQGPSCPYAGILARRLARDGYSNVRVFSGGWDQWSSAPNRPDARATPGAALGMEAGL